MKRVRTAVLFFLFLALMYGLTTGLQSVALVELPTKQSPVKFYSTQTRQDLRETYLAAMDRAQKSITLITFTMRDRLIIEALNQKAQGGLDVTVIYDANGASNLDYQLSSKIKTVKRDPQGITHQKILIVDEKLLLMGTANMTAASLRYYDNLVNGFWSPPLAGWLTKKLGQLGAFNEGPGGHQVFQLNDQTLDFWFLPDGPQAPERMKQLIRSAKKTLQIAMFTWTRLDFAQEVIKAHQKGIDVQVILDKQSTSGASVKVVEALKRAGVPLYVNRGAELLHNKTMIIDETVLVNGSANWTKSAFTRNDDCFYVLQVLADDQKKFVKNYWHVVRSGTEEL